MNYNDIDTMHITLMERYIDCYKTIKEVNESVSVIFIPLIGLDVSVYNNRPRCRLGTGAHLLDWKTGIDQHISQYIVNEGVIATNETLIALNARQKNSSYKSYYPSTQSQG